MQNKCTPCLRISLTASVCRYRGNSQDKNLAASTRVPSWRHYSNRSLRWTAACAPSPHLQRWPSQPRSCPRRRASSRTQSGRNPIMFKLPRQVEVTTMQLCLCQALEGGAAEGPDSFLAQVAEVRAERMTSRLGGEAWMHVAMLAWLASELQHLRELIVPTVGERLQHLQLR